MSTELTLGILDSICSKLDGKSAGKYFTIHLHVDHYQVACIGLVTNTDKPSVIALASFNIRIVSDGYNLMCQIELPVNRVARRKLFNLDGLPIPQMLKFIRIETERHIRHVGHARYARRQVK